MNTESKTNWLINGLLSIILALLVGVYIRTSDNSAYAAGGWETDGIMAMSTAPLNERLVIVDTKKQSICVYKTRTNKFRLFQARNYKYDLEIEDSAAIEKGQGASYVDTWTMYLEHLYKKK
jgi:hypothetical protein